MKIVIDTNILVAIIGRNSPFRWMFDCIIQGKISLCVSNEILTEYDEILTMKNGRIVAENVVNFINISPFTQKIEPRYRFQLIEEDEDDNKFTDCAIVSNADCLVSNDSHFQILKSIDFPFIAILTLSEFESIYKHHLVT